MHILYTHFRRCNKSSSTPEAEPQRAGWPMHGKKTNPCTQYLIFICHMSVLETFCCTFSDFCITSVLEMLQLFNKALICFLLEIHLKFTLNAFMTKACLCASQSWLKSKSQYYYFFIISHNPNSTVVLCIAWLPSDKNKYKRGLRIYFNGEFGSCL